MHTIPGIRIERPSEKRKKKRNKRKREKNDLAVVVFPFNLLVLKTYECTDDDNDDEDNDVEQQQKQKPSKRRRRRKRREETKTQQNLNEGKYKRKLKEQQRYTHSTHSTHTSYTVHMLVRKECVVQRNETKQKESERQKKIVETSIKKGRKSVEAISNAIEERKNRRTNEPNVCVSMPLILELYSTKRDDTIEARNMEREVFARLRMKIATKYNVFTM